MTLFCASTGSIYWQKKKTSVFYTEVLCLKKKNAIIPLPIFFTLPPSLSYPALFWLLSRACFMCRQLSQSLEETSKESVVGASAEWMRTDRRVLGKLSCVLDTVVFIWIATYFSRSISTLWLLFQKQIYSQFPHCLLGFCSSLLVLTFSLLLSAAAR